MAKKTKKKTREKGKALRRYDPRDSYTVGERIDFGPFGPGIVTDVLSWATPPTPDRHSLVVVTLDDGRLLHFAAGMGEEEVAPIDLTAVPTALPADEPPADVGLGPWRAALAQLLDQEVPVPGSRRQVRIKALSSDDVVVVTGHGSEILLPWRSLEAGCQRLQEYGQLPLSDLESLMSDVDVNLAAALLMVMPGTVLEGKPPAFYHLDTLERDKAAGFAIPLRPVHLSKSFVSIPSDAWPVLPLPPLGEHVYIPVIAAGTLTLCRLSHRKSPEEARLYLRGEAGKWLREQCKEDDTLHLVPLRNTREEFVALDVHK